MDKDIRPETLRGSLDGVNIAYAVAVSIPSITVTYLYLVTYLAMPLR